MVTISLTKSQMYLLSYELADIVVGRANARQIIDLYEKFIASTNNRKDKINFKVDLVHFKEKNNISDDQIYKKEKVKK